MSISFQCAVKPPLSGSCEYRSSLSRQKMKKINLNDYVCPKSACLKSAFQKSRLTNEEYLS